MATFLTRVAALKKSADHGDWQAEAELATVLSASTGLFWKLKAQAVLNNPDAASRSGP